MERIEQLPSPPGVLDPVELMFSVVRRLGTRLASPKDLFKRRFDKPEPPPPPPSPAIKISGYSLVLMDPDGQVIWTGEWDSGGVFEFRQCQRLVVYCGFTNPSGLKTEISEYEIELMGEDGAVVQRFNNSFGDALIVPPGESKQFPAEWQM